MKTDTSNAAKWVTVFMRVAVGAVFIFSGFSKAIDPWGTLYKFDDYLAALSISVWPNLELVGVFGLCAIEFLTGVFLMFGCFRRSISIVAAIIMAIMLPLTLWIAINNSVADCGCFGDAFVLSNWATFWKNVVISAGVAWLTVYNKRCGCLIPPALQWIAFVVSALFIVVIELFGYISQPLLDFRPYKLGESIVDLNAASSSEPEYVFLYEKDGNRKEYGENDELPDESEGWTFVERREVEPEGAGNDVEPSSSESEKTLRIWSKDGEEDETEDAVVAEGKELIVMMPDLREVSPATTWKLNSLYEWSVNNDVTMIAVVSGSSEQIAEWEDLSMASYPIYTADDTQIKEVVRGTPGVVYLVDGRIEWKSTLNAIDIDDFLSPDTSRDASSFGPDNIRILRNCVYIYLTVMAVLVILSFTPYLKRFYLSKPEKKGLSRESEKRETDE